MKPLPRNWNRQWPSIVAEADIYPCPRGRLAAKFLLFRTVRDLRRFWRDGLKHGTLERQAVGCVTGLNYWHAQVDKDGQVVARKLIRTDPRYFCVIGMVIGELNMYTISDEATHAGFAYAKRVRRTPWAAARDFDEEEVAYPTGVIAAEINRFLHRKKLYSPNGATDVPT